ncbi:GxxExxY protein [uncultured Marivirga sp.]|uniref:GxxExxY protein n=1 Tax=uncultured Marivirga sp. TaxID=1123707 RepID=UPI0030EC1FE8|tara:strand:+ start:137200 stop:137610 length:411 start_codon:yes stop_codon:yes gene_type:complete
MKNSKAYLNELTYKINGAAIEVHKELGTGLLENVYQKCLAHELQNRNIEIQTEKIISIDFKGLELDVNLKCDLPVEDTICIELKAVKEIIPVYEAQILSYMKLLKVPKGTLFNFNVYNLYNEGQKTFVNEYFSNMI